MLLAVVVIRWVLGRIPKGSPVFLAVGTQNERTRQEGVEAARAGRGSGAVLCRTADLRRRAGDPERPRSLAAPHRLAEGTRDGGCPSAIKAGTAEAPPSWNRRNRAC